MDQKRHGILLSYIFEFFNIIVTFCYTPYMVRILGTKQLGMYQLVTAVVVCLDLLNLGFSRAYIYFYSRAKHESEERVALLNGIYICFFAVVSLVCIVCGVIMLLGAERIFKIPDSDNDMGQIRLLVIIMILKSAINFLTSVFNCYISARERFVFLKLRDIVMLIANPLLTIPLIYMGYGAAGMAGAALLVSVINIAAVVWFCIYRLKMRFSFHGMSMDVLKKIWSFTSLNFLNSVIDRICSSSDSYLLGRILGANSVFSYNMGAQFDALSGRFSSVIVKMYEPTASRMVEEGADDSELSGLFIRVGRIQFILQAMIYTGFLFFGRTFLRIWLGVDSDSSYIVAFILLSAVFIPRIQGLGNVIILSKRLHKPSVIVYSVMGIGNIIISIPLIYVMGIAGAAAGTAIALLVGNIIFINWYYCKRVGLDIPEFWINILKFIPSLIPPVICGVCITMYADIGSFFKMLLFAAVYIAVYCCSLFFLGMNKAEKYEIYNALATIKNMLIRIKNILFHKK